MRPAQNVADEFERVDRGDAVGQDNVLNYSLADPSLMHGRPDFNDGVTVSITSIFEFGGPADHEHISDHIRPKAPNEFELYWDAVLATPTTTTKCCARGSSKRILLARRDSFQWKTARRSSLFNARFNAER